MGQKAAAEGAKETEEHLRCGQRFPGSMLSSVAPGVGGTHGGIMCSGGVSLVGDSMFRFRVCARSIWM